MDLDAFILANQPTWTRLDQLSAKKPASGPEADELVRLYQEAATHLSTIRSNSPDPELVSYLSTLIARARVRATGTRTMSWQSLADFFLWRFPALLYQTRRWWLTTMFISYAVTAVMVWWLTAHPIVQTKMMEPGQLNDLINHDFEDYYHEGSSASFASKVWSNNIVVAAQTLALSVFGVPLIPILFSNMSNLAVIAAVMISHGHAGHFFGLILPHGLLELTAIFVAAGFGFRVFWAWVSPGKMTRAASIGFWGRQLATTALGLIVVLLISGIIEGFVTPSNLPTWGRVGIGIVAEILFLIYVFRQGKKASQLGWSGDVSANLKEAKVAVAT